MRSLLPVIALLYGCSVLLPAEAGAVVIGLSNTFEGFSPTTEGWAVGNQSPSQPSVQSGGPGGRSDNYLLLQSGGGAGPGSRLVAFNRGEWTGDFTAAGVTAVSLSLRNFTVNTELTVRLALEGGPPGNRFATATEITLPRFGDQANTWVDATFSLRPEDLIATGGSDVSAALAGVTEFRILHNADPAFVGAAIPASLGADNIVAIPEPATPLLALIFAGSVSAFYRSRPGHP